MRIGRGAQRLGVCGGVLSGLLAWGPEAAAQAGGPGLAVAEPARSRDPNGARLFFGPTARRLPDGNGYFSAIDIVVPSVTFGSTDRVSVTAGAPVAVLGSGDGEQPVWYGVKLWVAGNGWADLAVGALGTDVIGGEDSGMIAYSVATLESPDDAVTLGAGYGMEDGEWADRPLVMIGLEHRMARTAKLIGESYLISGEALAVIAVRMFGDRRALELGVLTAVAKRVGAVLPVVNFVWNW